MERGRRSERNPREPSAWTGRRVRAVLRRVKPYLVRTGHTGNRSDRGHGLQPTGIMGGPRRTTRCPGRGPTGCLNA